MAVLVTELPQVLLSPGLLAPVTAGCACGYTSTAGQDHSL